MPILNGNVYPIQIVRTKRGARILAAQNLVDKILYFLQTVYVDAWQI